jgi:hypothetical protein
MIRATATLLAVAGLALGGTVSAASAAPFRSAQKTLTVEVTGIHVLDWHRQSDGYGEPDREWSEERGTETYGIRTPRPLRYDATTFSGRPPGGLELPPIVLSPGGATELRGVVQRRLVKRWNEIGYCGGEYGECTGQERTGVQSTSRRCGPTSVRQGVTFDSTAPSGRPDAREILLGLPTANAVFDACERVGGAHGGSLADQLPPDKLFLPGALHRIRRLGRGGKATFRASFERGWRAGALNPAIEDLERCPQLTGPGLQGCAIAELTIEVTRAR